MKWLSERLVGNWRQCWRWWSVQLHVVATLVVGLLLMVPTMPVEVQELLPPAVRPVAIAVWLVAGVLLRIIDQRKVSNAPPSQ